MWRVLTTLVLRALLPPYDTGWNPGRKALASLQACVKYTEMSPEPLVFPFPTHCMFWLCRALCLLSIMPSRARLAALRTFCCARCCQTLLVCGWSVVVLDDFAMFDT